MSKLNIPSIDLVKKVFMNEGLRDEREATKAAEHFLKVWQSPFDPATDFLAAMLSNDDITDLLNESLVMVENGLKPEIRSQRLAASISKRIERVMSAEAAAAEEIEVALSKMVEEGKFAADDKTGLLAAASKQGAWQKISKIKLWFTFQNTHYSSVRSGEAKGSSGSGLKMKCSTLRVAATTVGHNLATTLNWSTPWGSGSATIANIGLLTCLVLAAHFRGCLLGIIPCTPDSMTVGTIRNGVTSSSSPGGSVASHFSVWGNPGPILNNITYFANSSWPSPTPVNLYVSGNV